MNEIEFLIKKLVEFRDERDWEQFHNSKDLALAISIEASELNEVFLWKESNEGNVENIKEELADIIAYCLLLAHKHNFDITEIVTDKIEKNKLKYPIEKSKGTSTKYTDL